MGWSVLGLGQIDVGEEHMQEVLDLMVGDKLKVINKLFGNDVEDVFEDVDGARGYITFRMWGNKALDYTKLDKIRKYCKERNIDIEISVGEYTEGDESYYYNSTEKEEEEVEEN